MKQTEAADTIFSLLPQMKQEAPDKVITKYAKANRLSAAQVERLGHVFNTASTLATLEKDRNAAPTLLDVPQMVQGYVRDTGTSKRASFLDEHPEFPEIAAAVPKVSEVPRIWKSVEEPATLPKVAQQGDIKGLNQQLELACEAAERALDETAFEMQKYAAVMSDIAGQLLRDEDPQAKLATLLADTMDVVSPYEFDAVSNKLANAFRAHGVEVQDNSWQKAPPIVLSRDRTGFGDAVQKGLEHLKLAIHCQAQMAEALHIASDCLNVMPDEHKLQADYKLDKVAARILSLGETTGILQKEAGTAPKKSDDDEILEFVSEGKRDEYDKPYGVRHLFPKAFKGVASESQEALDTYSKLYGTEIPGMLDYIRADSPLGQSFGLTQRAERNQERARAQGAARVTAAQDTESVANLKKLILTDEILSTKDPERVVEAYNSIRSAAPEVAADISVLRLLLRQAMETQGVDIDTATAARKFTGGIKST